MYFEYIEYIVLQPKAKAGIVCTNSITDKQKTMNKCSHRGSQKVYLNAHTEKKKCYPYIWHRQKMPKKKTHSQNGGCE